MVAGTQSRIRLRVIGASVAVLLAGGLLARLTFRVPRLYAEAAADHHREVVDRQPGPWLIDAEGLASLAQREGIALSILQSLSRGGYTLTKGKLCRLEGRQFLHLVYTDGPREISAYLRPRKTPGIGPMTTADVGPEHLAIINGVSVTALFVGARTSDVLSRARAAAALL